MGIKHLWNILTPFCERKPLYELQGKSVAVDLSCWICEAQNIAEYQVQPRMYLRNLYFRTCYLLLMEVYPVFILEGKAPELKHDTIAARNAIQFKGAKPKTDGVKTGKGRSRFNFVLKNCEEMLRYMGLSCLTGIGEAESLCAYLNDEGLVDGCISQDSDCFAYGAKIVYRNFSIASQGGYSASGGAVDIYDIAKANEAMNFGRNKIIAMALLCGSDYNDGVQGVGKESVLKFLENLSDEETLEKLRSWRKDTRKYEEYERLMSDKNICTSCGHGGKVQGHNKNGCGPCGSTKGCNNQVYKEQRLKIKNELTMRSKSLQDPEFPNEVLIKEYLTKKDEVSELDLKWRQPNLIEFIKFTTKYLQWKEIYAFEKILPILTRWQCLNYESGKFCLQPNHIKKVRNPKGIPSYEIVWKDSENFFKYLIPEEQIEEADTTLEKLWSTIEPQGLVDRAFPELVEEFRQSKVKPKKATRRRKKDANVDEVEDMLKNTSISEPAPKKRRNTKKKELDEFKLSKPAGKQTRMDNFLKKAVLKNLEIKNKELELDFNCHTSTPSKSSNLMDMSCFGDEDNDNDLSDIIENMISRKPPHLEDELKRINIKNFLQADPDEKIPDKGKVDNNSSSFFITGPVENDLFEKTFNEMMDSDESTVEYEYDEIECLEDEDKANKCDEFVTDTKTVENSKENDSFCDDYVPLMERLKNKK